ncbi:hypothetical protein ACI65C_003366 [Semiaphis heraclei]
MPQSTSKNKNTNLASPKSNDITKLQPARLNKVSTSVNVHHSVDNQDVAMENSSSGNWSVVQPNKNPSKRNLSSSSSEPNSPKIQNNKKLFFTSNRFEVLSQDEPLPTTSAKPTPSNSNESIPENNINSGGGATRKVHLANGPWPIGGGGGLDTRSLEPRLYGTYGLRESLELNDVRGGYTRGGRHQHCSAPSTTTTALSTAAAAARLQYRKPPDTPPTVFPFRHKGSATDSL